MYTIKQQIRITIYYTKIDKIVSFYFIILFLFYSSFKYLHYSENYRFGFALLKLQCPPRTGQINITIIIIHLY